MGMMNYFFLSVFFIHKGIRSTVKTEEVVGNWMSYSTRGSLVCYYCSECYVDPGRHDMVSPWVADGGYSLQIWRVAMNILKK
jgi:hypothetical protein